MKRAHRTAHKIVWLLLAPTLAAIVWLAIASQPSRPDSAPIPPPIVD